MNRTTNPLKDALLDALAALSLLLGVGASAQGSFVMPSGAASAPGADRLDVPFCPGPLSSPYRYQQVFGASDISIPFGVYSLTAVSFRLNETVSSSLDTVIPDIEIRMSTTRAPVDVLQGLFAANTGSDELVVYPRGLLHISANRVPGNVQQPFEIRIPFAQPFPYDRSWGNLLLDVVNYQGSPVTKAFDAVSSGTDSVSSVGFRSLIEGTGSSLGLVAQFDYRAVPEPGMMGLFAMGVVATIALTARRGPRN